MTGSSLEEIQGRLRGLLFVLAEDLPSLTVGLVAEMIDSTECGVALETMSEMLVESNGSLAAETLADVEWLASEMGLDDENVDRLRPLVRELRSNEE